MVKGILATMAVSMKPGATAKADGLSNTRIAVAPGRLQPNPDPPAGEGEAR